jgi:hypothetical protein
MAQVVLFLIVFGRLVGGSVNGMWNSTFVMLFFFYIYLNGLTFKQFTFTYVNVHEEQP